MLRLREERRRRKWSQTFVSGITGIAQSDLSAIENGHRRAGPGWRGKLARAFGMDEADLFAVLPSGPDDGALRPGQ